MKERYEKMKEYVPEEAREHYKKAREEMRESIRALFPKEFIERRQAARKEMLPACDRPDKRSGQEAPTAHQSSNLAEPAARAHSALMTLACAWSTGTPVAPCSVSIHTM